MENILFVRQLTKYYGALCALDRISFQVPRGSVFGILGPNGSGKTTFLGIITDVLKASSGTFSWWGKEKPEVDRKRVGTLLETPNFYPYLSAEDNLMINALTKECNKSDIGQVLKKVHLYERRSTLYKTFSLGMKQRLAIASALLGGPEVVVLDEPTNGLDPSGIADIRKLIIEMGQEGKTVIIASHLLDEIQKVCTHVAILKGGTIRAAGPVGQILGEEEVIEVSAGDLTLLQDVLQHCPGIKSSHLSNNNLQLVLKPGYTPAQLNSYC